MGGRQTACVMLSLQILEVVLMHPGGLCPPEGNFDSRPLDFKCSSIQTQGHALLKDFDFNILKEENIICPE